nr:zinc finger, CCHC-type [Tanacetum cinerariifolium]
IDQEEVFVVRFFWKEHEGYILFGLPGSRQQKFLVLRFLDIKEQQGIDRRLEDKQPEEKTNTDCLVKEQEKEYQTGWKIKTEDTTRSTYLVNRSPSSAIRLKKPVDMLGSFGWLASIKQGILKPVKVKCIFLVYHKNIMGNKFGGTGSMQVLHGFKFEVKPLGDHTFEVEPQENVDQGAGLQEAGLKDDMDARSDVYVLSNGCRKCSNDIYGYYWGYTPAKGNILSMKIVRDHSGNTLRVSQSRFYNGKLGRLTESRYKLRLVAGIATGALVKGGSRSEVPAQVEVAAYRY